MATKWLEIEIPEINLFLRDVTFLVGVKCFGSTKQPLKIIADISIVLKRKPKIDRCEGIRNPERGIRNPFYYTSHENFIP